MKHNSVETLSVVPSGNSIIDAENNIPISRQIVETTIQSGALNTFANIVLDTS
jgi:hypothetical protein